MYASVLLLPNQAIERWSVRLQLSRPLRLGHTGSMLRGAFGHALKALACQCADNAHAGCIYQQIFEPASPANWPVRYRNCPPAYVLTPPPVSKDAQREINFQFTLLGPSVEHRALIWRAWQAAAERGFGTHQVQAKLYLITYKPQPA